MFDSGVAARDFVSTLKNEVDIALEIEDIDYIRWLNSLEQLLYREIILEQAEKVVKLPTEDISFPYTASAEHAPIRFEDIYTIFADGKQLIKSTLTSGNIFPDTYFKNDEKLGLNTNPSASELRIIYIVRPVMKEVSGDGVASSEDNRYNIKLPPEFLDLAYAKCRGEAYKLANENTLAANWLNDYNVLLENFKVWIENKKPNLGM